MNIIKKNLLSIASKTIFTFIFLQSTTILPAEKPILVQEVTLPTTNPNSNVFAAEAFNILLLKIETLQRSHEELQKKVMELEKESKHLVTKRDLPEALNVTKSNLVTKEDLNRELCDYKRATWVHGRYGNGHYE